MRTQLSGGRARQPSCDGIFSNNHNFQILKNYYSESELQQKLDAVL